MEFKTCRAGEVVFREGDAGDCMYSVQHGRIGIYSGYGTADELLLTELYPDQYFGEMGLLDHDPRSATAVALENNTLLEIITEESFREFYKEKPFLALQLMQQMSKRLRDTTADYVEACRTVCETAEAKKKGQEKSPSLLDRIMKFCRYYDNIING